jgi:hypothetical protein
MSFHFWGEKRRSINQNQRKKAAPKKEEKENSINKRRLAPPSRIKKRLSSVPLVAAFYT